MSHRPNPPLYYKYTDEDGNIFQVTLVTDATGQLISPVSNEDLFLAATQTNTLLEEVVFLLKAIGEA